MQGKIFQISTKPINKDDYLSPTMFFDICYNFADFIGIEIGSGKIREECLEDLSRVLRGVFTFTDGDAFAFNGKGVLRNFLNAWAMDIKAQAAELDADNILTEARLSRLGNTTEATHRRTDFRFYIDEWNKNAEPMGSLINFAAHALMDGERIYVGAIIDYYY